MLQYEHSFNFPRAIIFQYGHSFNFPRAIMFQYEHSFNFPRALIFQYEHSFNFPRAIMFQYEYWYPYYTVKTINFVEVFFVCNQAHGIVQTCNSNCPRRLDSTIAMLCSFVIFPFCDIP